MITAYYRASGQIHDTRLTANDPLPANVCWVDLLTPGEAEREAVSKALGIDLPTMSEMEEIEASSRLYTEGNAVYLTTAVLIGAETPNPGVSDLTIVLAPHCLVTLRFAEPRSIDVFAHRVRKQPDLLATVDDGMLSLLDAIIDRTADILELIGKHVDDLSRKVFHPAGSSNLLEDEHAPRVRRRRSDRERPHHSERLNEILRGIGQSGDMVHRVRDCLSGLTRMMAFLGPIVTSRLHGEQLTRFKTLDRDLRSLSDHAQFLAHESGFLLDATLGQINIEQNNIIKIFSVTAVGFLPPTLLASVWGMNFDHMPELHEPWGYALAWVMIIVSAIIPFIYFKRRGWL
ncbi:MAG: magnesium transporter [Alphaproteobacteria bacterium]|nr:magnesium transporter [Alphaproteobacteria bacterium]